MEFLRTIFLLEIVLFLILVNAKLSDIIELMR